MKLKSFSLYLDYTITIKVLNYRKSESYVLDYDLELYQY